MSSFADLLHSDLANLAAGVTAFGKRAEGLAEYSGSVTGSPAFSTWTGGAAAQARAFAGSHADHSDRIAAQARALAAPLGDYATSSAALKASAQQLVQEAAAHGFAIGADGSVQPSGAASKGLYAQNVARQLADKAGQLVAQDAQLQQSLAAAIQKAMGGDKAATPTTSLAGPDLTIDKKAVDALDFTDENLYGASGDPSQNDIFQKGGIGFGDCWFASAMGATAMQEPGVIKNAIQYDPKTKSFNVSLYDVPQDFASPTDSAALASSKRTINISQDELKYDIGQAGGSGFVYSKPDGSFGVNPKAPVWPAVMEAAYGKMRYGSVQAGVGEFYSGGIAGGTPDAGLKSITGHSGTERTAQQATYNDLATALANHRPVEMGTTSSSGPNIEDDFKDGLCHNHAYMVTGVSQAANGDTMVTVRNPWGTNYVYDSAGSHAYIPVAGDPNPRDAYYTFDLQQANKDSVVDGFSLGASSQ
ncbi:MAG: C2 family cysteine protease [Segniliparus sp.]|uniref:C2 family cysteine protease n=1 Tax=Segniliparus sp. TaxID=2804064 RepID=UPI003F3DED13